jgi:hypothetical protein
MPAQNRITKPPAKKRVAFFVAYFVSTKPRLVARRVGKERQRRRPTGDGGFQACRKDFSPLPAD